MDPEDTTDQTLTAAMGDVEADGTTIVAELSDSDEEPAEVDPANMYRTFTDQPLALVGTPTADGRMLAKDIAYTFRTFPQPFMWCEKSKDGHDDSYTVGVIESGRV